MCGVSGAVARNDQGQAGSRQAFVKSMVGLLGHRGPDASAIWTDPSGRVTLGHARLAVVDVSDTGAQPMTSRDQRWTITYNGELYNTEDLRRSLGPIRWRGHSDTEVLVEHIAKNGVQATLTAVKGMFAFGCWDAQEHELWLARDRFGEKPIYFVSHQGVFLFASELKALRAVPGFNPDIDRNALQDYFRWTNVPAPQTIYEGVSKLPPAHFARVRDPASNPTLQSYWSAPRIAATTRAIQPEVDVLEGLKEVLDRAVESQMVSDVPLGAFLSGGIDSSSVVAAMQRRSSAPVKTFTIGFEETDYDESRYAEEVATVLGTDHTGVTVSPRDAMQVIPSLPAIYDEPFADSSQIPTYLLSKIAREHVTVALSGDGGDELFGGYDRYQQVERLRRIRRLITPGARRTFGNALRRVPVQTWDHLGQKLPRSLVPLGLRHRTGHRMHKVGSLLAADSASDVHTLLMSVENERDGIVLRADGVRSDPIDALSITPGALPALELSMLADTVNYLPNDLLTKIDRASMAVSLEVRVPFLDPEVFEYAWSLPRNHKIRNGQGKWVLRELLRQSLPDHLIDRPKMGFGIPIGQWIRGPLRSWANDLLDPTLVREQGFLDPSVVDSRWKAHRDGRSDLTFQIWSILMFQAWITETQR